MTSTENPSGEAEQQPPPAATLFTLKSAEDYTGEFFEELANLIQSPNPDATEQIEAYYQQTVSLYADNGWSEFPGWSAAIKKATATSDPAAGSEPFTRVKTSGKNVLAPVKKDSTPLNSPSSVKAVDSASSQPKVEVVIKKQKPSCKVCGDDDATAACSKCQTQFHQKCMSLDSRGVCADCLTAAHKERPTTIVDISSSASDEISIVEPTASADVGSTPEAADDKGCAVCKMLTVAHGNTLLQCSECKRLIHQNCHQPVITTKLKNDPRFIFVCMLCTRARSNSESSSPTTSRATTILDKSSPSTAGEPGKSQLSAPDVANSAAEFLAKHKANKKSSSQSTSNLAGMKETKTTSATSTVSISRLAAEHQARQQGSKASSSSSSSAKSTGTKSDSKLPPALPASKQIEAHKRMMAMKKKANASRQQGSRF